MSACPLNNRCVLVIKYCPATGTAPVLLYKYVLSASQTGISVTVGLPDLHPNSAKERRRRTKEKQGKIKENGYILGQARPSLLPLFILRRPYSSSSGGGKETMHRTFVSRKKASTAPAAGSSPKIIRGEGARGYFHPRAFPIPLQISLACGAQVLHPVIRWTLDCRPPPPRHKQPLHPALPISSCR